MSARSFILALGVLLVIIGAVLVVLVQYHAIAHALLIGGFIAIGIGVIVMIGAVVINES